MPTELSGNLPRLASEMHIAPFEQGRTGVECFLVETREGAFLVNGQMRCLLEALVEQSSMSGLRAQLEASLGKSVDEAQRQYDAAGKAEYYALKTLQVDKTVAETRAAVVRAIGDQGMTAMPSLAHKGIISRSSSR